MELLLFALGAYLIGSIPFGLLLTRAAGLGDIRAIGSGNIGATNVLRTGNKKIALATLLLDFGKGFVPIWLLQQYGTDLFASAIPDTQPSYDVNRAASFAYTLVILPTCVVLGHLFPVWLRFKGGKGVACLFGLGFALSPVIGGWMAICWLTVFAFYRYSSLAALLGIPAGLIIATQNSAVGPEVYALALPVLLMIGKHHANIRRLLKGEEHRFSFGKKKDNA